MDGARLLGVCTTLIHIPLRPTLDGPRIAVLKAAVNVNMEAFYTGRVGAAKASIFIGRVLVSARTISWKQGSAITQPVLKR